MMGRALVIGYGNTDRGDDGAAFHVVNRLRSAVGRPPLAADETGLGALGGEVDAVFVRQLVPELAVDASGYDRIVFCDAHVIPGGGEPLARPVLPERRMSGFGHVMHPEALLWLVHGMSSRRPDGYLVALRGFRFEEPDRLSAATAAQIDRAVARIRRHLAGAACVALPHDPGGDP